MSIQDIRREYTRAALSEQNAADCPFEQFSDWFQTTLDDPGLTDPTAMVLSTFSEVDGVRQRIVLLKGYTGAGFQFFTNYQSAKGTALLSEPRCSLHFSWLHLERQITIEGKAQPLSDAENDAYFATRPRASQLGAWASRQSQPISDRHALEQAYLQVENEYQEQEIIPRPPHWGGFLVVPSRYEFWQGGAARLHDRIEYVRTSSNEWFKRRLQP
ncbi:MAG: pyridoxamine 5'-phosphate oxidase PdxH [Idiomarinaceae bacterium HL-53]|nr:MAG: pyridoxamine 5'-phosphate oxidase PdxH [Idiomarinaceae bacterium HL-53]CUS48390.1 Pyridoxamine 5'-phosphate oxidase [Idiomarinaceae bacterium HL-53]